MAEKISELSGDAREKRIAELKAKMQAASKKALAEHEDGAPPAPAPAKPKAAPPAAEPTAAPAPEAKVAPTATAEAAPVARPPREAPDGSNGAAAPKPAATKPAPKPHPREEPAQAEVSQQDMGRREFLTYAWGATLGILALQGGVVSFLFMYPRFRAGEFGGKFILGPQSSLPAADAPPQANPTGKFWLVTTEEGDPKALYMVCTHLGCLYKWEGSNGRFECPCHGSKFTHDGFYIEGPAPRSLDSFELTIENDTIVVDTGSKITGAPASESPARAAAV